MGIFNGKYYISGEEERDAVIELLRDKLSISIKDEYGNPRTVFWPYSQVILEDFRREGNTMARTKGYPSQFIEAESVLLAEELTERLRSREANIYKKTINRNWVGLVKVFLFFVLFLVASYLWLVPYIAERLARRVPVSYEESLGNGIFNSLSGNMNIDKKRTLYINEFFQELKIPSKYHIRITLVNDDIPNAFALPGGNIVVYDKILEGMKSYEDLAALLSHEFTHVNNKHTTRSIFRQLGSSIFLSVIIGDLGAVSGVLLSNADELKSLSYSRSLEKEADLEGLRLLSERKIDGNGFVRLFGILKNEMDSVQTSETSEWVSSHPNLDKRIKYIRENDDFNKNGVEKNETLSVLFGKIKESY